jgi:hypothetical protein
MSMTREYDMRAGGYDFANRSDIHALCTMAVESARTGTLVMQAEGYHFTGNHDFGGQSEHPGLPRAMVQMAIESAQLGTPVYHVEGKNYSSHRRLSAIVDILTAAILTHVPEIAREREEAARAAQQQEKSIEQLINTRRKMHGFERPDDLGHSTR